MPDDYEKRLAEWKTAHGIRELSPDDEDDVLRAADKTKKGDDYCVICGNGPQPISGMALITRRDDPYIQPELDDEDDEGPDAVVRACPKCWAVEYGDQDELSDDDGADEAPNAAYQPRRGDNQ